MNLTAKELLVKELRRVTPAEVTDGQLWTKVYSMSWEERFTMYADLMVAKERDSGWIPVSQSLPGHNSHVIACIKKGDGYFVREAWYGMDGIFDIANVTHWMPFPPPAQENNGPRE